MKYIEKFDCLNCGNIEKNKKVLSGETGEYCSCSECGSSSDIDDRIATFNMKLKMSEENAEAEIQKILDNEDIEGTTKFQYPYREGSKIYFLDESKDKSVYVGCDNEDGYAWIDDFETLEEVKEWLRLEQ